MSKRRLVTIMFGILFIALITSFNYAVARLLASQPVRKLLNGVRTNIFIFTKSVIYGLGVFMFLFFLTGQGGCGGNDAAVGSSSNNNTPSVTTNPATDITHTSALLNGTVNPNGLATSVCFDYGTTTSYGNSTGYQYIGFATNDVYIWTTITGLLPNTTYNFRIRAIISSGGIVYNGNNLTFTTVAQ